MTQFFLPFDLVFQLTVKCLSVIVRGCLWLADRLAYVVLKLEAKDGA